MKTHGWSRRYAVGALVLGCLLAFSPSVARADRKDELRARFAQRLPQLRALKSAGKVGETTKGLVEAVNPADASDPAIKSLVDDENADRQALFAIIAKEQGTDIATVAERAARRNYERAQPGDYLKTASGEWKRK